MGRKTFEVEDFKNECNRDLANPDISQEAKYGITLALHYVLHKTGNYKGFSYNYWDQQGWKEWRAAGEPNFQEKSKYIGPEFNRRYS